MAKSVLHPLGMSSKLLEDLSYLNWKCHVTYLLLQVTYLAPHVCPYCLMSLSVKFHIDLSFGFRGICKTMLNFFNPKFSMYFAYFHDCSLQKSLKQQRLLARQIIRSGKPKKAALSYFH